MFKRAATEDGFTIVEVLIVIAISTFMLVAAIAAVGNKQQTTEFQTSVETLKSEFNQSLASVSDGNYSALNNNISCKAGNGQPQISINKNTPPNGTCTIIGEVIGFSDTSSSSSYTVFPAFGRNYAPNSNNTQIATNLTDAMPVISNEVSKTTTMPFGLHISTSYSGGTISQTENDGAIGLFSFTSFEGSSTGNGQITSGAEHVEMFVIPGVHFNSVSSLPAVFNGNGTTSQGLYNCGSGVCLDNSSATINPSGGVTFCLDSGTSNQSALFSLGGNSSPTSATYKVYSQTGCK